MLAIRLKELLPPYLLHLTEGLQFLGNHLSILKKKKESIRCLDKQKQ